MTPPADAHNARLNRLREQGYKLTHARTTVLAAIEGFVGHPTAADVLAAVEAQDPAIGRASVFRALELFTQLSIVRPAYASGGAPTYVLLMDGHHHHVVCVNCRRTIEFEDCGLEALRASLEARMDIRITGHLLEFYAVCATCQPSVEASR